MRIFLTGFMGVGKSYWGKIWGETAPMPFIDLDALIEAETRMPIARIFEMKGEEWFRQKEAELLRSLANKAHFILSCGGGTPCFHDNMRWMNQHGFTVLLEADPFVIVEQLQQQTSQRPLLAQVNTEGLLHFIVTKLAEREHCYRQAKLHIRTGDLDANSIFEIIDHANHLTD